MARARTVAVVVPSPAVSLVFDATSCTSLNSGQACILIRRVDDAPRSEILDWVFKRDRFRNRHTVLGDLWPTKALTWLPSQPLSQNGRSWISPMMTVLPFGPRVALTAFASTSTPFSIPCRASLPKMTSFEAYPRLTTNADCNRRNGRGSAARDRRTTFMMVVDWEKEGDAMEEKGFLVENYCGCQVR